MSERKSTGGTREFSYSKEDLERIRKTDTHATKDFKEAYHKWEKERIHARADMQRLHAERKKLIYAMTAVIALLCIIALVILLLL